jgi:hypothetical protein
MQRSSLGFRQLAILMITLLRGCVSKVVDCKLGLLRMALAVLLACGSSFAQQSRPAPEPGVQSSQPERTGQEPSQPPPESSQVPEKPRLFKVFPMWDMASPEQKSLSSKEKFGLYIQDLKDPFTLINPLIVTSFSEVALDNSGFGWGAAGFGKQYGAATTEEVSNHLLGIWLYPSLFHQDPRYYPKQSGGFWRRVAYSVICVAITRTDNGERQINYSRLAAALTSSVIRNSYYPAGYRGVGETAVATSVSLGALASYNLIREFLPDLNRLMGKGHRKTATGGPSGSQ